MWICKTEQGVFWIRFSPQGRGVFVLGIEGTELGAYASPEAAADDVYHQETGFSEWDSASGVHRPADISDWKRLDCADWDCRKQANRDDFDL